MAEEIAASSTPAPAASPATETVSTVTEAAPSAEIVAPAAIETPAVETQDVPKESTLLGAQPEVAPEAAEETPTEEPAKEAEQPVEESEKDKPEDKADEKPVDKKDTEEKPADDKQSEEAPLPTYEAFAVPDGVSLDTERLGKFAALLGEFEGSKPDHEAFQKFGQSLVDQHVAEVQHTVKRLQESYSQAWEKQKNDWKDAFEKDPELGGNRRDTTLSSALQFIRTHGGTEAQQGEFRKLMDETGIGNHPAMIRLLSAAGSVMSEGGPVPASKPMSEMRSKIQTRYGKMANS